jgi:hypothetical protein
MAATKMDNYHSSDDETIQRLGGSNKIPDKRVLLLQMVAKRTKTLVVATFERGDLKPKLPRPPFFGAFGTGAPNFLSVRRRRSAGNVDQPLSILWLLR